MLLRVAARGVAACWRAALPHASAPATPQPAYAPQAQPRPAHRLRRPPQNLRARASRHRYPSAADYIPQNESLPRPLHPPSPAAPRAQKKARACYSLLTLDACTSGLFFASRCRSIVL